MLHASLALLLAPALFAPTAPLDPNTPHEGRLSEDAERLERALAAIRLPGLMGDLRFLADDEMRGRDTPSPELRVAALFLAARLERLGFSSAGSGDFFYTYDLHRSGIDPARSGVGMQTKSDAERIAFGEGYFLNRMSHAYASAVRGPVVSVGRGTKDEFRSAALDGAWALLFDGGVSIRRSQRYAEEAGAAGILFAETPELHEPYAEKFENTTDAVLKSHISLRRAKSHNAGDELPILMLSSGATARMLALAGVASGPSVVAGTALDVVVSEDRVLRDDTISEFNVAGFWPGRDPELAREVIVVSAHYDHVGARGDRIFNGADDNASGTTGLLGVAEALAAYGPMRRSVLLLWLSGEEKGLWGSEAWTKAPQLPEGAVAVADINIDMIGRTRTDELYLTPTENHDSFNAVAAAAYDMARLEGFDTLLSQDADWERSDHYNFDKHLGIPVAFLSAGEHPDYHKPTDTAEKIDFEKLARITRIVVRMLDALEDGPLR